MDAMPSLLVVDDEPAILRMVTVVLQDSGWDVAAVHDAEQALEVLQRSRPDVILSDVRLPGMDGVQLAEHVKSEPELASTPVLLMSAGRVPPHRADGFLPKPFDIDELASLVEEHARRR